MYCCFGFGGVGFFSWSPLNTVYASAWFPIPLQHSLFSERKLFCPTYTRILFYSCSPSFLVCAKALLAHRTGLTFAFLAGRNISWFACCFLPSPSQPGLLYPLQNTSHWGQSVLETPLGLTHWESNSAASLLYSVWLQFLAFFLLISLEHPPHTNRYLLYTIPLPYWHQDLPRSTSTYISSHKYICSSAVSPLKVWMLWLTPTAHLLWIHQYTGIFSGRTSSHSSAVSNSGYLSELLRSSWHACQLPSSGRPNCFSKEHFNFIRHFILFRDKNTKKDIHFLWTSLKPPSDDAKLPSSIVHQRFLSCVSPTVPYCFWIVPTCISNNHP